MSGETVEERIAAANRLLEAEGLMGARVRAAGHEREIAAVSAPHTDAERIAALVPEIKRLGFRYVALDLGSGA